MHLPARDKLRILNRVTRDRETVVSVCQSAGISRKTFYSWLNRYHSGGSAAKEARLSRKPPVRRLKSPFNPLLSLVVSQPQRSTRWYTKHLKLIGFQLSHMVIYRLLKQLNLETKDKRYQFSLLHHSVKGITDIYLGKRRLLPSARNDMVEAVVKNREKVGSICRRYGISRKTFAKWKKRYLTSQETVAALVDSHPRGHYHRLGTPEWLESQIVTLALEKPKLSAHGLAHELAKRHGRIIITHHGIHNVLSRHQLSRFDQRLLASRDKQLLPQPRLLGQSPAPVAPELLPTRSHAPPPLFLQQLKRLPAPFLLSFFVALILSNWLRFLITAPTFSVGLGWFFASLALLMGTVFFLYSFKYYLTIAVVLSFSRQAARSGEEAETGGFLTHFFKTSDDEVRGGAKAKSLPPLDWSFKGILANVFGIEITRFRKSLATPKGLETSMADITLTRHPFISIHIPLYNEKRVAERILRACLNFDYPNFEVIVIDDSTDETTKICDRLAETDDRLKVLHRTSRAGFKGGALKFAADHMDSRSEFIVVFDADFVPYPDTLEQFLKYFQATAGTLDFQKAYRDKGIASSSVNFQLNANPSPFTLSKAEGLNASSNIAAVQGYQWHVLNKSENWITRGVRSEFAGSYVIERSGEEIYGGLKQIAGSVYMLRVDALNAVGGWGTSITEDFELTLRLYEAGFKVLYTPYIQAPSQCVATFKRLVRQRMRWAEGHSNNVKRMF